MIARLREQEAGGVGVIFVNSKLTTFAHYGSRIMALSHMPLDLRCVAMYVASGGETLFVPHGTDDDAGGDIRIPAVCLRKKDGDMLLAIASMGHQGTALITMEF